MGGWVNGLVAGWMYGVNEWVNGWVNGWVKMDAWMQGCMDGCMKIAVSQGQLTFPEKCKYVADAFAHVYTVSPMLATLLSWPHRHLASNYPSMTPNSQSTDTAD